MNSRKEKFKSSLYPNCLFEWNKLDPELRLAPSVAVCKRMLLSITLPQKKSVCGIHDPIGSPYLAQLRVGLSKFNLKNIQLQLEGYHKSYVPNK